MLENARVTAFTDSELLRENQQGGKIPPPSPILGLSGIESFVIRVESFVFMQEQLQKEKIN